MACAIAWCGATRLLIVKTPTHIRKAGFEALDTAFYLLQRFFTEEGFSTPAEEIYSSLQTMLKSPTSALFLAYEGAQAKGVATVTTSVGLEYGRAAELEDLYVLPSARGKWLAGALIEAVCLWCREQGCTTVLVTVTPQGETSHSLIGFYGKQGFVNTRRVILERRL
jgi:aminoglycoside 6'-N-acetyltransferase I